MGLFERREGLIFSLINSCWLLSCLFFVEECIIGLDCSNRAKGFIYTDIYVFKCKGRLARLGKWSLFVLEFKYVCEGVKGEKNYG
jgi:hypothetical protein